MNMKLKKLLNDIQKTEDKIAELQELQILLERYAYSEIGGTFILI